MKIATFGARFFGGQISRIEDGFRQLGHEIDFQSPDVIFSNDPAFYEQAYSLKQKNQKAKLIFNVLDLPPHYIDGSKYDISRYSHIYNSNRDFDPKKIANWLDKADVVTCICAEVQWQIKNWCGLDSVVIFNPIKDVSYLNISAQNRIKNKRGIPYKYLYVGRACDINKRFNLVYETINKLGDPADSLAIIGSENPGWGDYYGVLEDGSLNYFYNSVEYFMFPSAFKSIGLPALEAVVCQTIPIVTNDDPVTKEFWSEIGVDLDKIAESICDPIWNTKTKEFVKKNSAVYKQKFDKVTIANNILNLI
jgi:glycosyltransferase involved in cell wall biosynthesis